ncbi:aspartyl/asparaginyl beta-hydroxylase domain-containing protein [Vibrio vulnificus]|uniref:aspartyl/asparaginyl beta-hydroxylase domain-containing protein n=1 Tax=Vibrio vulnificus TaxID=672 RepID=UPI001EEBB69C|nr:aspartyl/asparaginyl beta-hydroxylase domain-containing protein [Vibrio vulnificus]MCG6313288.1 aspartyl/asparaginyl beta-hydroxylase domain-containing protein [Vibrio vulnificus]
MHTSKMPSDIDILGIKQEINSIEDYVDWTTNYSPYQNGKWKTISLFNQSGISTDTTIRDGEVKLTDLSCRLPKTTKIIEQLNLDIISVRIAQIGPNGFLWEHVDYKELDDKKKHRLHIPIVTHEDARMCFTNYSICMTYGKIWKLNPTTPHGIYNGSDINRIHIIIDCYENSYLDNICFNKLEKHEIKKLPQNDITNYINKATRLASLGFYKPAESLILKLFHRYTLEPGEPYKVLMSIYESIGNLSKHQEWKDKKTMFMGNFPR